MTRKTTAAFKAVLAWLRPKPAPLPPILTLQHFLTAAYTAERANLEPDTMVIDGFTLKSKDFAISIILIDGKGDHYAGNKDTDMYYSGSLVKVAALYAAHDLRAAARQHAKDNTFTSFTGFSSSFTSAIDTSTAIPRLKALGIGLKPDLQQIFVGFRPSAPDGCF